MKTVAVEVRSIHHIRIEFKDFCRIFTEAKTDPSLIGAFSRFDLNDTTMGNLRDCFKKLEGGPLSPENKQACEDLKYVVRKLGFDGIENYGGFFKDDGTYHCVVYNMGSDL